MFLVWVVTGLGWVGLVVDRAAGDAGRQSAGSGIGGHNDLLSLWKIDPQVINTEGFIGRRLIESGTKTKEQRRRCRTAGRTGRDHHIEALIQPTAVPIEIQIASKHWRDRPVVFDKSKEGFASQRGGDLSLSECLLENHIAIDQCLEALAIPCIETMKDERNARGVAITAPGAEGLLGRWQCAVPIGAEIFPGYPESRAGGGA